MTNDTKTSTPSARSDRTTQPADTAAPSPGSRVFANKGQMDAAIIGELRVAGCLAEIIGDPKLSKAGVKLAYEAYMLAAGNPTDPIERMLLEQMLLVHHRLAALHVQAAQASTVEISKVYTNASARMLGELRRSALTLRQYRLPPGQKSFTVVGQQNIATGGGQQDVRYTEVGKDKETLHARNEMNGKEPVEGNLHEVREQIARGKEPAASGSRTQERETAAALVD